MKLNKIIRKRKGWLILGIMSGILISLLTSNWYFIPLGIVIGIGFGIVEYDYDYKAMEILKKEKDLDAISMSINNINKASVDNQNKENPQ